MYESKNGDHKKALEIIGINGHVYTSDSNPANYTVVEDGCKVG